MVTFEKVSSKRRVLIVDDDTCITQMLAMLLQTKGFEVQIAVSGKQAIKIANEHSGIDIILLDLMLPDVEGFEVCRRLKEEKDTHNIPIIILSAKILFEDKVEGLYLGADDYLTKPFEHEELFARMEAVMRRNVFVNSDLSRQISDDKIIFELKRIIAEGLITPYFQPIYMLKPFKIFGYECLSRPKTQGALSNPEVLFKAALQFGFYSDMEMLAWSKALEKLSTDLTGDEKVFLNCSPYLVEGSKLPEVKRIFSNNLISPNKVFLEITERSAILDFKTFFGRLEKYRDFGFRVAVDDVGGGFASLESIVETRPEVVKIDGHIISNLTHDHFKRSIVKFIVSFCRENGIITIAEGIETESDLRTVLDLGVDAAQGYFLSRPSPFVHPQCACRVNLQ